MLTIPPTDLRFNRPKVRARSGAAIRSVEEGERVPESRESGMQFERQLCRFSSEGIRVDIRLGFEREKLKRC